MIIYTNGCSFTSGADLDPGDNLNREKELSWPSQLSEILSVPVINNALGGACQERITLTSKEDLRELKKSYNDIVAVIQITYPGRLLFPEVDPEVDPDNIELWDSILASEIYEDKNYKIAQHFLTFWSDRHIYTKYYSDIENIINFCTVNQIKLLLIPLSNERFPSYIKDYFINSNFYWGEICINTSTTGHPALDEHVSLARLIAGHTHFSHSS